MSDTPMDAAVEQAPGLTQMQRVTYAFTAPSKTFEDIKRGNKSWWMPWLIMALLSYAFFAVVANKIGMQQVSENQIRMNPAQQEKLDQAPPEQKAMSMKISVIVTEAIFALGPGLLLAGVAFFSLVLMGTINFGFGGRAKFTSLFAVWFYAYLPGLIKTLLGIVVIFAGTAPESFNIKNFAPTNAGAFLNPADTNKALYALATSLDVVSIWCLVLLSIGVATVAGTKRSSGYAAVFGWWAIMVLCGVGIAAAFGG